MIVSVVGRIGQVLGHCRACRGDGGRQETASRRIHEALPTRTQCNVRCEDSTPIFGAHEKRHAAAAPGERPRSVRSPSVGQSIEACLGRPARSPVI